MIMTGQAQNLRSAPKQQFKDYVCDPTRFANVLFDCANGIYIDVQNYPAFANVAITDPIVAGNFVNNAKYCPGQDGDIWSWCGCSISGSSLSPGSASTSPDLAGSKRLLSATAAFKNEPFPHLLLPLVREQSDEDESDVIELAAREAVHRRFRSGLPRCRGGRTGGHRPADAVVVLRLRSSISSAVAIDRKVTLVAHTLADLISRSTTVTGIG